MSDELRTRTERLIAHVERKLPTWRIWYPNEESEVDVPRADLLALIHYAKIAIASADFLSLVRKMRQAQTKGNYIVDSVVGINLSYIRGAIVTGIELISAERTRQIFKEGWTSEHDDWHIVSELADAACCYLRNGVMTEKGFRDLWPWDQAWWKPTTEIRNLVKAGALIAAEIDRLLRLENDGPFDVEEPESEEDR